MALLFKSADGDKDVMANLAARLKGKAAAAAAPKPAAAAAAPRSMPAPQLQSSSTASSVTSSVKHVPASSVGTENIAPKQTLASTFVKASEDVNMTDINSGPSLFGSADQLAEARQFASSATSGGHKSRPASRRRLASKEPERPPSSSSSSSTRTRLATTAPNSGWQTFSNGPSSDQPSRVQAPSFSLFGNAVQQKQPPATLKPAVAPTPAPTPVTSPSQRTATVMTERVNGSNLMPSPTKAENKTVNSVTKEAFKPELSHAHPILTMPVRKDEAKSLQAKQLADITNTFKERAANATPPPHLRSRAAAAGIPERKDTTPIAVTPTEKTGEAAVSQKKLDDLTFETPKTVTTAVAAVADKMSIDKPNGEKTEAKTNGVQGDHAHHKTVQVDPMSPRSLLAHAANAEKVLRGIQAPKIKTEPDSLTKTATLNGVPTANGATAVSSASEKLAKDSKADADAEIFRMLESVEKTVTVINARIMRLEEDNFEMQKQLVGLVEERERRQFLGTDSGKMPFGMEVNALTYAAVSFLVA